MNVKLVELDGELVSRAEYCRRKGYSYEAINSLMYRKGLDFHEAVIQYLSIQQSKHFLYLDGENVSVAEYCRKKGYSYKAITALMYKHNLTVEDAIYSYITTRRKTKCQRLRNI